MATKLWVGTSTAGDWSVAANWSPAGVPVNADDVYLENSEQDVSAGLDQSAVALASLHIAQSYRGKIGTATAYLQIASSIVNIGHHYSYGSPAGSGRIKLDLGATAAAVVVANTGTPYDSYLPAVRLKCNHANTTLEVRKGKAGVACEVAETSTIGTIKVSYTTQKASDADMFIGSGVTLTALTSIGGDTISECGMTTLINEGGNVLTAGSGAITTLTAKGGVTTPNSTGTITTLTVKRGEREAVGTVDFTKSQAARTVTTCKLEVGGVLKYDPNIITFTNKIISDNAVMLTAAAA